MAEDTKGTSRMGKKRAREHLNGQMVLDILAAGKTVCSMVWVLSIMLRMAKRNKVSGSMERELDGYKVLKCSLSLIHLLDNHLRLNHQIKVPLSLDDCNF